MIRTALRSIAHCTDAMLRHSTAYCVPYQIGGTAGRYHLFSTSYWIILCATYAYPPSRKRISAIVHILSVRCRRLLALVLVLVLALVLVLVHLVHAAHLHYLCIAVHILGEQYEVIEGTPLVHILARRRHG